MTAAQINPAPYIPDHAFPPGETLRERLNELGISQADLAARSGLSVKHVNQIVQGVASITPETALLLERVTGTPARIWNALEAAYQDAELRSRPAELTLEDRAWLKSLPLTDLRRRGKLRMGTSDLESFRAALDFFGVADRQAWERVWLKPHASFRRSRVFKSGPGSTAAWLRLGELDGRSRVVADFDSKLFRQVLIEARALTRAHDFSRALVARCAAVGVVVVFVKETTACRASGAARWLSPKKALIQLSDRYKREDSFWFSFFHEAAHILLHPKRELFVDADKSDDETMETEANLFAANLLVPPTVADTLPNLRSNPDVIGFAAEIGIAAGIVVGRLHNDGIWPWNRGNELIKSVEIVPTTT